MALEHCALVYHSTLDLELQSPNANIITCKGVFILKYYFDGTLSYHKAQLVTRGFIQVHGIKYSRTFSSVIRMNSICVILYLVVNQEFSLQNLYVSKCLSL